MIDSNRLNHKMLWFVSGFNLKFPRIFETAPQHIDFTELRDNEKRLKIVSISLDKPLISSYIIGRD